MRQEFIGFLGTPGVAQSGQSGPDPGTNNGGNNLLLSSNPKDGCLNLASEVDIKMDSAKNSKGQADGRVGCCQMGAHVRRQGQHEFVRKVRKRSYCFRSSEPATDRALNLT